MGTYNVGIGRDDIQDAILLPEDWYEVELLKDYEDKNQAWKNAGEKLGLAEAKNINEKAGKNIILNFEVKSEVPEFDGRRLTKWLPLPNEFDEGQYDNRGQHIPDAKAEAIHNYADVFGTSEGSDISFAKGRKGYIYVIQDTNQNEEDINAISMNLKPKSLESGAGGVGLADNDFDPLAEDSASPTLL